MYNNVIGECNTMNNMIVYLEKSQDEINNRLNKIDTKLSNILSIRIDPGSFTYFEDTQCVLKKYNTIMPFIKHFYTQTERAADMMEKQKRSLQIDKETEQGLMDLTFNHIFETAGLISERLDTLMEQLYRMEKQLQPDMW